MAIEICPDERALRSGRRQRALEQMAAHDLDVLVLGRQPTSGTSRVRRSSGSPVPGRSARPVSSCARPVKSICSAPGMKVFPRHPAREPLWIWPGIR